MTVAALPSVVDVYAARRRLAPYLQPTPLVESAWLSSVADATVHLKLESLQQTGSFKVRGALNALLRMAEAAGRLPDGCTVVTASAGNHGRALAFAAERLGVRCVVFTPRSAPEVKKAAIRRHGAELRDDPADYDAAEAEARSFAHAEGLPYLSAYAHADVVAGAGTVGLEIVEAMPDVDTVVVPVGGGGLASGIGLALSAAAPDADVIGVESALSPAFTSSLAIGRVCTIKPGPTLADGLAGNLESGSLTFPLVQRFVSRIVTVDEPDLARAVRGLAGEEHLVAEGAGAIGAAAVLTQHLAAAGRRAVVLVTGGNIDLDNLTTVLRG